MNLIVMTKGKAVIDAAATGKQIATARNKANLSQAVLSERAGISRNYLALCETGARRISTKSLRKIQQALTSNKR